MASTKDTSYDYGRSYQMRQVDKYRDRENNHWKQRIEIAHQLVDAYRPSDERDPADTVVVDVGCSIGTFALEFARAGYQSYGVDFDSDALEIAASLAEEEGVSPVWVCDDVSSWGGRFPAIDIAVCFDIFEHLHDDELGAFLRAIGAQLSDSGVLVFHTFPTTYEHIFFGRTILVLPLVPFFWLPSGAFARLTKSYASMLDALLALFVGKTYRERLRLSPHCNPLNAEHLAHIIERSGFKVLDIETGQVHPLKSWVRRLFARQPVVDRSIWGAAAPTDTGGTAS